MRAENEKGRLLRYFIEEVYLNNKVPESLSGNKNESVPIGITFMWTHECNLKCQYCYMKDYGKDYFKGTYITDSDVILQNSLKLAEFVIKTKMHNVQSMDIFTGGKPILDGTLVKFLHGICSILEKHGEPINIKHIMIPMNIDLLVLDKYKDMYAEFTAIAKKMHDKYKIYVAMSISIDGPFLDPLQRTRNNVNENSVDFYEETYDKLLDTFNKRHDFGLHPMTYSENIDLSIDNFLYINNTFGSHYNLIVRNYDWTISQCISLYWFFRFVVRYVITRNSTSEQTALQKLAPFNLIGAISSTSRGHSCSIQSSLEFMLHEKDNIILVPCHRQAYPELHAANIQINDDMKAWSFEGLNIEYFISIMSSENSTSAPCSICPINAICKGGCLGMNYESNDSPFIQTPTTCRALMANIKGVIDALYDTGAINELTSGIRDIRKKEQIKYIHDLDLDTTFGGDNE